jgi:hypothetical protein
MKKQQKQQPMVEHHIIYGLPDNMKRQNDLTAFITEGFHTTITDVMYSVKQNDRMAGWCLIFEGLKRLMKSDIEKFNQEKGYKPCSKKTKSST